MYFSMFPKIYYDTKGNNKFDLITNLLNRVKIKTNAKTNIYEYDYYDVQDGETPEMIAFKYYGRPDYHWTIIIANDIIDYYEEWPMSVQRFEEFIKDKYPNSQDLHHYEINQTSGDTTKIFFQDAVSATAAGTIHQAAASEAFLLDIFKLFLK